MEKYLYEDLDKLENSHWWHRAKREAVCQILKQVQDDKVGENKIRILDIGCGTGGNLKAFAKIGEAWGIDSAPEAIKFCKDKGLKNVRLGSSDKTGFDKESFNIVTLLDVLEHVEEGKTLKEIDRILEKEGELIITVPAFSWLWSKWDEVLHHKRRYTNSSLRKVLKASGFKVQKMTYMYSFLVLPALVVRFIKSKTSKGQYSSDFELSSPILNTIFIFASRLECVISKILPIPFGTSLICVATK